MVATEFKNRFMRFGLDVEAIVDYHTMLMNSVRVNENCLVIGISLSGATKEVIDALEQAAMKMLKQFYLQSRNDKEFQRMFDEVVLSAVKKKFRVRRYDFSTISTIDIDRQNICRLCSKRR